MDEFSLFLKLAKPLVLNLPNPKDRTIAAQWLNKLRDVNAHESDSESENISVEYLKLLLYAVQSNKLTGIFGKPPPEGRLNDILEPGQRTAMEMISLVKQPRISTTESQPISKSYPRVITSIGGDMCDYVAVQEIPNFGIHGYYALSTDPLPKWWYPQNSITPELEISSPGNERDSIKDSKAKNSEEEIEDTRSDNTVTIDQTEAGQSKKEFSKKNEKMRHSEKSLRKIFQAQRNEIAGVETRPCWGRSRYIDRLIDESPHHIGDLDLSEADALLHLYQDRKLMKVQKNERNGAKDSACALSSRRRQVEARLDMPPCASIPVEEDFIHEATESESRTCLPREIESEFMNEAMRENYGRCCLSENEEYYPTDPIESVGSISLRGGSDDTGLVARPGCCKGRRDRQEFYRNQQSRNISSLNYSTAYEPQSETVEGIDVDTEIAMATGLANGNVSLDSANAGNFAWVKRDMRRFLNDHTEMSSTDFKENTRRPDRSERYYNDNENSPSTGCPRRIQQSYGGQADRWTSGNATQPLHSASQKTILRSKAASPTKPGVDEKARYYWEEMINFEDRTEDPSMPESYDTSCCGCRDKQYESEISVHAEDYDDHDFPYENEEDTDQDLMMVNERRPHNRNRAMVSPNEANALQDEMHRLIADPARRAPPSRGRVKAPRKKLPLVVGESNVADENWDPPNHNTRMSH